MADEVYLEIDTKDFEKKKLEAIKRYNKDCPNDEPGKHMLWPDLEVENFEQEFNVDKGSLDFSGRMMDPTTKKDLGYVSFKLQLDMDTVLEILQSYMKKLGKLKTVLEATK